MDEITQYLKKLAVDGDHSASTLRSYSSDLRRFKQYVFKYQKELVNNGELSPDLFLSFLNSEHDLGFKPSTLHRRKVTLTQFADYLFQNGIFQDSDLEKVTDWKPDIWLEIKQRELHFLTESEIQQLFDTILNKSSSRMFRDVSIISLVLETGLSIDPIIKLNVSDLKFRTKQVRVEDGDKNTWYSIPDSVSYLQSYLENSRPELTQSANEEALFVSQMGSRITRQGVWQVINGWGEEAGLSVSLSPRILRHTSVVQMIKSGKSIRDIQKLIGHTNIFSTKALIRKLKFSASNKLTPEVRK